MLRAVRFSAKLNFDIAADTAAPIRSLGKLLRDVPPARLFEETLKLFHAGSALRTLDLLIQFDLLQYLFPHAADSLRLDSSGEALAFLQAGLANTDRRIKQDLAVTPMFLYAVLMWHPIVDRAAQNRERNDLSEIEALLKACDTIVSEQQSHTSYPRRFSVPMKDMLVMQGRLQNRRGMRALRLLMHKRFRAAYDFLLLRARCGEVDQELADWWTEVQTLSAADQRKAFTINQRRRRRRPSSGKSSASEAR